MATITETTTQDKPRNHESGQDQTQKRVTLLCQMFQYGASKASRLVRKYESLTRLGHAADTDEAYVEYLVNAAGITTERAHTEALSFLMHSDPTGNAAVRNVMAEDPTGRRQRGRAEFWHELARTTRTEITPGDLYARRA